MRSRKVLFGTKLNNKGMSLVEVIIAITILGLVAVPVLHSLTTAMVYNQKARNRQEMTLTAESIMETFKGYELESTDPSDTKTLTQRFTAGGVGIEGVSFDAVDSDSGFRHTSSPVTVGTETANKYTFYINDMRAKDGKNYDVTITATPNSVEKVLEMPNTEATRDAIFQGNRKWDKEAVSEVKADFAKYKTELEGAFEADAVVKINDTVTAVQGNIEKLFDASAAGVYVGNYLHLYERTLTFDIISDGDDYKVTPKMVYSYYLKDYPYYVKGEAESRSDEYPETEGSHDSGHLEEAIGTSKTLDRFPVDGSYLEYTVDLTASDSSGGPSYSDGYIYKNKKEAGLNRLVVYYYPQYDLEAGHDKIVVKNTAGIPDFQCYILKQRAADINESQTKIKENSYQGDVYIDNSASGFEVFHNFDDNIAEGSSTTTPSISGIEPEHVFSYTKYKSGTTTPELVDKFQESEVLSYKIELKVEQGGREITKLESTMNEKIKD